MSSGRLNDIRDQLAFYNIREKVCHLVLAFGLAIFIPKLAYLGADITYPLLTNLDPENVFGWNYLHHLNQMLLALLIILLPIWSRPFTEWGFNFRNYKWTLKVVGIFCIVWIPFSIISILLFQLPSPICYTLNSRNLLGDITFDFILTGFSEETLFRSMVMGILLISWKHIVTIKGFSISIAGIIAAVIFTLGHIGFSIVPLHLNYINPVQLIFAFGLGIFYAFMYDKSESLLGPILAHNVSDGSLTLIYLVQMKLIPD